MREDIRLLGAMLGDTVREQNGPAVFDLVERARVESFRVRRSEIDRAEMARMFSGVDIHQAIPADPARSAISRCWPISSPRTSTGSAAVRCIGCANPPRPAPWPRPI